MTRPGLVPLASFVWSFGVVALLVPRYGLQPSPVQDVKAAEVPPPFDLAVAILRSAERFSSAGVGYAGLTPNEVMAWRVIFFRPNAQSTFLNLLETATPAGQLYALAGLRFAADSVFERAAASLEWRSDRIRTVRGCIGGGASVSELVSEIRKGEWVRDYIRGSEFPRRL